MTLFCRPAWCKDFTYDFPKSLSCDLEIQRFWSSKRKDERLILALYHQGPGMTIQAALAPEHAIYGSGCRLQGQRPKGRDLLDGCSSRENLQRGFDHVEYRGDFRATAV